MTQIAADKENRQPIHPSFATKAAKAAVKRSITPQPNQNSKQIDKVVESVANATKRLSLQSTQSSSSKRKVENRIGPWRLGRTLGKGSTGRVRLAKHTTTGKLAAVKIVPKTIIDYDNNNANNGNKDSNNKQKKKKKQKVDENGLPYGIEREIIIMKLISHPNIMALYDVWENKNELFLVLEYVEGGELFDFLINNGRLSEKDAVAYFRMIINGVAYCHKFNICHRDLKPENILLDKNGKIKIADFGMAALETQQKLLETSCGSPHYASPEIVAGKTYHGSPSDVWSCGVILFALLTGHLPFDDPNIRHLLMKVQTGKFHMPSNLSNEAKDLIWSMLRVNPNERIKIEDIAFHPLMRKYPDTTFDKVEDQLDHLDISKPVARIDPDILNNLQTLWHGIPQPQIVKKLRNPENNSEKMFYYLLENYKLTHLNSSDNLPNLQKSISKTTLNSKASSSKTIPRSSSTIITTIQDKDGNVLKSETQQLKSTRSPLKPKNKNLINNSHIVASTSYNKSVSFQRLKRDSSSNLSLINMKRNLSIHPEPSISNLHRAVSTSTAKEQISESIPEDSVCNTNSIDKDIKTIREDSTPIIDNSDISRRRSLTVNPKDLPDLPDLHDYKYLMKTIFADSTVEGSPSIKNKNQTKTKTKTKSVINEKNSKVSNEDSHIFKDDMKLNDNLIVLDLDDSAFSNDPATNDSSMVTSNYTSSLDPRNNSYSKPDKSPNSIKNSSIRNTRSHKSSVGDNTTNTISSISPTSPAFNNNQSSKLEMLKKELSSNSPSIHKKFSSLKSIKSTSTRRLNTFLNDEYKNVKVDDVSVRQKKVPSVTLSHQTKLSIDVDSKYIPHEDTTYSLHSAVQMKLMTPTEEELKNLGEGKMFEDADESLLDKNLISDSAIQKNITVHRNVLPNADFHKGPDLRNSLITTSTTEDIQPNERLAKKRISSEIKKNKPQQSTEKEVIKEDEEEADELEVADSVFDDADELPLPKFQDTDHGADDTFDSEISGSLYTSVEEQPPFQQKQQTLPPAQNIAPATSIRNVSDGPSIIRAKSPHPFSELRSNTRVRNSMTPTTEDSSPAFTNSLKIVSPPLHPISPNINKVNLSPVDAIPREKNTENIDEVTKPTTHAYRMYVSENVTKPVSPVIHNSSTLNPSSATPVTNIEDATAPNAPNVMNNKKTKRPNWLNKVLSAFNRKPSEGTNQAGSYFKSDKHSSGKFKKFSFKFKKSKYTPRAATSANTVSFTEHWLESDIVTGEQVVEAIKKDDKTKLLKFTANEKTSNGWNYTIQIEASKTIIRMETVEKVGSEYGFGGCYMKFVKIKGHKDLFDYWCGVIRDLVASMEKAAESA